MSWACRASVSEYATAGPAPGVPRPDCPTCRRPMTFEGSYPRQVREAGQVFLVRVRRAGCKQCSTGHALLPDFVAYRRKDSINAIGAAITAALAATTPTRSQACLWAEVPASTVRSWRQRFAERAELLTAGLLAVVVAHGGYPAGLPIDAGPVVVAAAAIGAAWWAVSRQGQRPVPPPWRLGNVIVGSHLVSTRVDLRWAGVGRVVVPKHGP